MAQFWKTLWNSARVALTGQGGGHIPRDQIIEALDDTIAHSHSGHYVASVLMFEIDRFRALEETVDSSHVARIIRTIEDRLLVGPCLRDMMRNFGGGRFAVIPSPTRPFTNTLLETCAAEIHAAIQPPVRYLRRETQISVSVGFASQKDIEIADGETLLEAANAALLAANRQASGSTCHYSSEIRAQLEHRRLLAKAASTAMHDGQIQAYFQPQVDLKTNKIVGLEALARWHHKDLGMLPPAEFLPVLEEFGMMQELGLAMLRDALGALQTWDEMGLHIPTVSINMSTEELLNPNLVDAIRFELDAYSIAPQRLVIEILETVVAGTHDTLISDNIRDLHDLGCAIDLDDFGTGHASITTIRQFSVDRIKIDRSFVFNVGQDEEQQQMVQAILTMSQQLRIATLAEGVETESEIAFLSSIGCSVVQGYAVSRPMPQEDVPKWAQTHLFGPAADTTVALLN